MRERQSNIIGFTEAELGIFIAILVLIIVSAKHQTQAMPVSKPTPSASAFPTPNVEATISALKQKNLDLQHEIAALQNKPGLRSRSTPTCKEKGIANGPIFRTTIEGRDSFRIGDDVYDIDGLRTAFSAQISAAKAVGCSHVVYVYYGSGVTLPDYLAAVDELNQEFYTKAITPEK